MLERRSYNDGTSWRCTVRFKGEIPQWPHETTIGVEWDDPERGRNNGELDGVQYFTCTIPNSGSFLKASRRHETPISFEAAITAKYLDASKFEEIKLSEKKTVETVGVEKIHGKQSNINALTSISVEGCLVNTFEFETHNTLSALKRLDLSNNLFSDFKEVLGFLSSVESLQFVRLNGNRFDFEHMKEADVGPGTLVCPQIEELEMANTLISSDDLASFDRYFPNLQNLSIAHNRLSEIPSKLPARLSVLDVAFNPISHLQGIPRSVKSLYAPYTHIFEIQETDFIPTKIDLRNKKAFSWDSISRLGTYGVTELQLYDNKDGETALKVRPFVITRCPDLRKLDGTPINSAERFDAGLYTMNAVVFKKHPPLPQHIWDSLIALHGTVATPPNKSIQARLISFYVDEDTSPTRIVADAPIYRLHWLVATRLKQSRPNKLHIRGITDVNKVEGDALANIRQVGDFLSDGQRIFTYSIQ